MTTARTDEEDIQALAKGGRTNVFGFMLRLAARIPFLFIAGRLYGPEALGRFAYAILIVEFAALKEKEGKTPLAAAIHAADPLQNLNIPQARHQTGKAAQTRGGGSCG